jgi:hypothetical protein
MPTDINVVVISAYCCKTGGRMGIRLEEKSRKYWIADWAFKVKESVASKEGYEAASVDGHFEFSHEFPGCPYCQSVNFVLCDCKKLLCYDSSSPYFECPKCGLNGIVGSDVVTSLSASQDS